MLLTDAIREERELADAHVFKKHEVNHKNSSSLRLFSDITKYKLDVVTCVLGQSRINQLNEFVQQVDLDHPDLNEIISGTTSDLWQIFAACEIALQNNWQHVVNNISKMVPKEAKASLMKLDSPLKTQQYIRLLKNSSDRWQVRATKAVSTVDLSLVFKKLPNDLRSMPNNFASYYRLSSNVREEIVKANKVAVRYKLLGCKSLEDEVRKAITKYEQVVSENHYGFNRITMTNAALILANMHDVMVRPTSNGIDQMLSHYSRYPKVVFSQELIDFVFRAFPLDLLNNCISPRLSNIIDHLEAFPGANGKAIFDHYIVLVPGLDYPRTPQYFYDRKKVVCYDTASAQIEFAKALIEDEAVMPIVLGEKDGRCYFITYW